MRANKYSLIFMLSLFLSICTSVKAQEVVWLNGQLVIDNSALPAAALYDNGKTVEIGQDTKWTNQIHIKNRVSRKFAVALTDIPEGLVSIGTNRNAARNTPCASLGEGWRVPNQRELMLIWVLKESLIDVAVKNGNSSFSFSSTKYWSSTCSSSSTYLDEAWSVNFDISDSLGGGYTNQYKMTNTYNVRCVIGVLD